MPIASEPSSRSGLDRRTLSVLATLYSAQSIPLGFFIVALPAIARAEGLSLERVGLLGALAFPYLFKFLWAPLVDRYGSAERGHYRSWIVPLAVGSVIAVVGLSLFEPARTFAGDAPVGMLALVASLTALFMLCAATQDAATDGLAVRLVPRTRQGLANGVQVGGYYLGQVLGGGLILALYGVVGWRGALGCMALFLLLPLWPLRRLREPPREGVADETLRGHGRLGLGALAAFFRRPGVWLWSLVLVGFRAGESMALAMLNPMLVDRQMSLETIGFAVGVVGSLASLAGALVGGGVAQRLGSRRALVLLGGVQAMAILTYVLPARDSTAGWWLVLGCIAFASATGGAATAALYSWMMNRCTQGSAASDFTIQQSLCAVGPLLAVATSGFSAATLGYAGHFVLCATLALAGAVLIALFVSDSHAAVPRNEERLQADPGTARA